MLIYILGALIFGIIGFYAVFPFIKPHLPQAKDRVDTEDRVDSEDE